MKKLHQLWTPIVVLLLVGCVGGQEAKSKPEDMSAEEHRKAAERHKEAEQRHREQFDPDASRTSPIAFEFPVVSRPDADPAEFSQQQPARHAASNPTEKHLRRAREHRRHAEEHRSAARHLESSTDAACAGLSPQVRTQCPLLLGGAVFTDDARGVLLSVPPDTDVEMYTRQIRCHMAHAREEHFEGMQACPLFVPDLELEVLDDGALLLVPTSSRARKELDRRMGALTETEASPHENVPE